MGTAYTDNGRIFDDLMDSLFTLPAPDRVTAASAAKTAVHRECGTHTLEQPEKLLLARIKPASTTKRWLEQARIS